MRETMSYFGKEATDVARNAKEHLREYGEAVRDVERPRPTKRAIEGMLQEIKPESMGKRP